MKINKNYSDNFSELLKSSNFVQIIEPKLVKKYTLENQSESSLNIGDDERNLLTTNFLEGTFSYSWYDNVLKQNSYLVSIGLKSPISVTDTNFINNKILHTRRNLPLILSTDEIFYNKVDLYNGYLLKSKSMMSDLLSDFRGLHKNLILNRWKGDVENLQFSKLKFNVTHLNQVHAGLTVGLGGLKLFLPKGHKWMVYFPPNGHLRRLCVGNMNLSLALLSFCLDFQKQLKNIKVGHDPMEIIKNKDIIIEKLEWYQQVYNNYFNQFENDLIKSTLLRQFKLKYLQLNNFYSLIINSSLKWFITYLKKLNNFKKDGQSKSDFSLFFDIVLFLSYFVYLLKDINYVSRGENFKDFNKNSSFSFHQKGSEVDSYFLQYLPFSDLKEILAFKNKTSLNFIHSLSTSNILSKIFEDMKQEIDILTDNLNNEEIMKLNVVFHSRFTKELLNNFLKWTNHDKEKTFIEVEKKNSFEVPLHNFLNLFAEYIKNNNFEELANTLNETHENINDNKNIEQQFLIDFYNNADFVEENLLKLLEKEHYATEDLRIVNTNNNLISYVVSRKANSKSFDLKLEQANNPLYLI